MTTGTKTHPVSGKKIEIVRIIPAQSNGNGVATAVYKHLDGGGKPTTEFTMSQTVYEAEGWS